MLLSPDSYSFIYTLQISHIEEGAEKIEERKRKTEKKMYKTLDERRKTSRQGEWEAWHVISKVNPRHCWLLIRGSVGRRRQRDKDKDCKSKRYNLNVGRRQVK